MKLSHLLLTGLLAIALINTSCVNIRGQQQQVTSDEHKEESLAELKAAAAHNDPEALLRLGDAYIYGRYGLTDTAQAFPLMQEAVKSGNPHAMTDMGIIYLKGYGTAVDYRSARTWFEKAAAGGDIKAPRYIGQIYQHGWGTTVDYEKAASSYRQAAERGDITSQYYLGQLYEQGLGVTQDYQQALALYQQSAARGDHVSLPAILALVNLYEQGLGVERDITNALEWYTKAAALGDDTAKGKIAEYQYPENPYLMNITALVRVIGDGQKVAALALEYKEPVAATSVSASDFQVPERDITSIYLSDRAAISDPASQGRFVIVELKTTIDKESAGMGGGPQQADGADDQNGPPAGGGPQLGQISDKPAEPVILSAQIIQTGELTTTDGQTIAADNMPMESNATLSPDTAGFQQLVYHDDQAGRDLMYNLYMPENYDPAISYPLVLFMHDAGAVSNNPIETLTQGSGAVVWASTADQARHQSFVLAPQYDRVIVGDGSAYSEDLDMTVRLIKSLLKQYSIDPRRLYNTGQSMGGMTSIAMDIKYPDLFAASFLVACQWDPGQVAPLANKPLWIVVSEGDSKAHPGMDAITAVLKEHGASVANATWDAEADAQTLAKEVKAMLSRNARVNYTLFKGGDHRYTWQYAYSIPGIRDWLFEQHK